ncbi:MAG: hypothetical protein GY753_14740 [Gammaproteobacteria bacterium]|nr:hypothetical protein [Gammaproteobacteria bacterium]
MQIKYKLGILLFITAFSSGQILAAEQGKAAAKSETAEQKMVVEDPQAAAANKVILAADAARKKAGSVGGEWRDTGKMLKQAKAAVKSGAYDKAIKLAEKAGRQGELGYTQATSQQKLQLPSYVTSLYVNK